MRREIQSREHPLRAAEEKRCAKDERGFFHAGSVLYGGFGSRLFRGIPGRSGFGRVAVVDCRDCRYRNQCLEVQQDVPV